MIDKIRILDCTLRDGGWVNQFRFGTEVMQDILYCSEKAGAEFVELGYMDLESGARQENPGIAILKPYRQTH